MFAWQALEPTTIVAALLRLGVGRDKTVPAVERPAEAAATGTRRPAPIVSRSRDA